MPSTTTDRLYGLTTSVAAKAPCRVATTANIALSGLQTVNGVALAAGDRVLVKDKTNAAENGIYTADTGDWTRSTDFDGSLDVVKGTLVFVHSGDTLANSFWTVSSPDPIVVGASPVSFANAIVATDGYVTPEQFGCPAYSPGTNQQPFIQAAILYAEANGLGVYFPQTRYEVWATERTVQPGEIQMANDEGGGVPVTISKQIELKAAPSGTTFLRKAQNGGDPNVLANWQTIDDGFTNMPIWRGGGVVLKGLDDPPDDPRDLAGVTFSGRWVLDGGLPRSATPGLYTAGLGEPFYTLYPDGAGWDVYDEGIRFAANLYTGDLRFDDLTITGFRGECIYQGGIRNGGVIGNRLELSQGDADGFNPSLGGSEDTQIQIDHLYIHHVYQAWEGAMGYKGHIKSLRVEDCTIGGHMQAGQFAASFDNPDEGTASPVIHIGTAHVARTPSLAFGRNMKVDNALFIDCTPWIGHPAIGTYGVTINNLTHRVDRAAGGGGVLFYGTAVTKEMYDNRVGHLHLERTNYAITNSYYNTRPVDAFGSLGDNNFVDKVTGYASIYPAFSTALANYHVGVGDISGLRTVNGFGYTQNIEVTPTLTFAGSVASITTTTAGNSLAYTLPPSPHTEKLPIGSIFWVRNSGTAPQFVNTTHTTMTRRAIHLPGTYIRFRFTGTFWELLDPPAKITGTSGSVNLQKSAADIPAGDVSDETTFAIPGARAGMSVRVTPTTVISGDALLIGRVTANDTVGIRAQNMNLGAALAIGAAIYRVELEWPN